jgi:hypothetical protein
MPKGRPGNEGNFSAKPAFTEIAVTSRTPRLSPGAESVLEFAVEPEQRRLSQPTFG